MTSVFGRVCLLGSLVLSGSSFAQNNEISVLHGQVEGGSELVIRGYVVALEDCVSRRVIERTDVGPDGGFQFRHVPYGDYLLKLENYQRDVIQQTYVGIKAGGVPMSIRLPRQVNARPPAGGVAASRLRHPPAKKAVRAFAAAQRFSESGRFADAARELGHAIEISPEFADAYSNLGAQYVRLGRYDDAIIEIERAMAVGGTTAVDLANLACAQFMLRRFAEATLNARAAVQADPINVNAHYILGKLLARDRRTLPEAIPHLKLAAESITSARLALQAAQAALATGVQRAPSAPQLPGPDPHF